MKGTPKWTRGSILEQISEMEMPKDKERPKNFIVQAEEVYNVDHSLNS